MRASVSTRYVGQYLAVDRVRKLGDFAFVDANLALDLGKTLNHSGLTSGLAVEVGAVNLFDTGLEFSGNANDPWDRTQGDLRGRFIYARLIKSW